MKAGVGWKVGLYNVGVDGNGGAEGPNHEVWLTSLAFFSSSIRSSVLFFLWTEVGCMVRIATVKVAEKLFGSIRRSTAFSVTTTAASDLMP